MRLPLLTSSAHGTGTAEVEEAKVEPKVLIRILITFPSFYPHAQPSFTYLPGTTIDQERQIFLKRVRSLPPPFCSWLS
jgi:hypothetical protein